MRNQQHSREAATFGFEGLYQFEKFRVDADCNELPGTRDIISPWQGNLITDAGLNYLGTTFQDNLAMCRIGTGNTAPANSDTALGAQVGMTTTAGTGNNETGVGSGNTYIYRRVVRRFPAGTLSGVNLSEVGMAASSSASLFSRSLIKDTGGVPTTITLAADEVLDVSYELRMYVSGADVVVPTTIDGVATDVTIRAQGWPTGAGWADRRANIGSAITSLLFSNSQNGAFETQLPASTSVSSYPGWNNSAIPWNSYVPGSFSRSATVTLSLAQGNYSTGVGALVFDAVGNTTSSNWMSPGAWSIGFSPKLNKTSARTATITFGLSWGRYTP